MGFLEELKEGRVSEDIRKIAAENAIPLPLREQFEVLAFLLDDPVEEIADKAALSLMDMPRNSILSYLSSRDANPELLKFFADFSLENRDYEIVEAVVRNPSTPDGTLVNLASKGDERIGDLVISNQIRAIANRKILEAIVNNPNSSIRSRAQAEEWLRLYYSREEDLKIIEVVEELAEEGNLEEIEVIEELEEVEELEELLEEIPEEERKKEKKSMFAMGWDDIKKLPIPAKIKLALMGTKMHRAILIRDPNKTVVDAVLESPKLTEDEIEGYSKMKSLPQEVIRKIANTREWTRSYTITVNLVKNPKTPPQLAMSLLRRLREKEIKEVAASREVPAVIRREAQKLLDKKKNRPKF